MDWLPFEISVVGIPADHTIGIGRSDSEDKGIDLEIEVEEKEEKRDFNLLQKAKIKLRENSIK
jgi:hypothetical protein